MRKICFVCSGNTCRSPMAEKLLKKHLKDLNISDVEVCSLGLSVIKGDKTNPKAVLALSKFGIKRTSKLAKQITVKDLKKDILFITMTQSQKQSFGNYKNVFTFGELVDGQDIPDPYGLDQNEYDNVANILNDYTNILANNLKQY